MDAAYDSAMNLYRQLDETNANWKTIFDPWNEFRSQSYEWLVVNQAGTNAQFKGSGLINGAADANGNAYKFMLWAGDASPDTFRIRIWWEDAAGEHDVYDNGTAQAIGAGNIVMHTGK